VGVGVGVGMAGARESETWAAARRESEWGSQASTLHARQRRGMRPSPCHQPAFPGVYTVLVYPPAGWRAPLPVRDSPRAPAKRKEMVGRVTGEWLCLFTLGLSVGSLFRSAPSPPRWWVGRPCFFSVGREWAGVDLPCSVAPATQAEGTRGRRLPAACTERKRAAAVAEGCALPMRSRGRRVHAEPRSPLAWQPRWARLACAS